MGMEGINWDEVNAEAKTVYDTVRTAEGVLYKMSDDFADELSVYWASGNAVEFGKQLFGTYKETRRYMNDKVSELEGYISRASQIYATTFNVSNGYSNKGMDWWGSFTDDVGEWFNNAADDIAGGLGDFKTVRNGQTGINKIGAQQSLDKYKANLATFLDELSGFLTNRNIAIFDTQNAQKEAYNLCVSDMKQGINDKISSVLELVTTGIDTEIENARLAKERTVSTFSA